MTDVIESAAMRFWLKMHREGLCTDPHGVGHWAECQRLADALYRLADADHLPELLRDYVEEAARHA